MPEKPEFFHPVSGIGQGDVHSPQTWKVVFDILLTALELCRLDPLPLINSCGLLYAAQDQAFADNLVSLSAKLGGLQAKADVVSAFAVIFNWKIAYDKLRVFKLAVGQSDKKLVEHLVLHTAPWIGY